MQQQLPHLLDQALHDWVILGIYIGNHHSEWAQHDGANLNNIQTAPNNTPKAFIVTNLKYFGKNNHHMPHPKALCCPYLVASNNIQWRWPKNGQNNKKKCIVCSSNKNICTITATLCIATHANKLHLPLDHPFAIYMDTGTSEGNV